MNIVFVEDNENLREAVRRYLELEGMTVHEFSLIREAERKIQSIQPDLFILDVMLPDGDGFLFAKRIRAESSVPIIFLTARTEESDRITGLEIGADDYVVKPFSPKELVLRVKAVLKRSGAANASPSRQAFILDGSRLEISGEDHLALLDGQPVSLTAAEWKILEYLTINAPRIFNRGHLLSECLDSIAEGSERTIDTHVKNIRRKLGEKPWIETVRGFGYRFKGIQL